MFYREPSIFTFCVNDRKCRMCWNMLVLCDAQQGGETSVLPSPLLLWFLLKGLNNGNNNEKLLLVIMLVKSYWSISLFYLILLCHSRVHSRHQALDPEVFWVGADSPLFLLCPFLLHQKPAQDQIILVLLPTQPLHVKTSSFSKVLSQSIITGRFWEEKKNPGEMLAKPLKWRSGHSHNGSDVAIAIRFLPPVSLNVLQCILPHGVHIAEAAVAVWPWEGRRGGGVSKSGNSTTGL